MGNTETVNEVGVPSQPLNEGVTLTVEFSTEVMLFTGAVHGGSCPFPFKPIPIVALVFCHVNVEAIGFPTNDEGIKVLPGHEEIGNGGAIVATGFTKAVACKGVPGHVPKIGVIV